MKLALVKRIAERYVPGVCITHRQMPPGVLGLASGHVILYATGQSPRERALTIFHEVAHLVFDQHAPGGWENRCPKREERADRFAAELVQVLELGDFPREVIAAARGRDHTEPVPSRRRLAGDYAPKVTSRSRKTKQFGAAARV